MAKSSSHIMCSSASLAFLVHLEGCASRVFASILYLVPVSTDIPFWRFKNFRYMGTTSIAPKDPKWAALEAKLLPEYKITAMKSSHKTLF